MTRDNAHTYAWDADGNTTAVDSATVTHDALDRIVEHYNSGAYYQSLWGSQGEVALASGQSWAKAMIPLPAEGKEYIQADAQYTQLYHHPDWLGSQRYVSTANSLMDTDLAYAPFGEYYAISGESQWKVDFTGQIGDLASDPSTGLYDFMAREYAESQGRWIQPDPAGLAAVNPNDPQSWNRYAYVRNNPLEMVDPLGLDTCPTGPGGMTATPPSASCDPPMVEGLWQTSGELAAGYASYSSWMAAFFQTGGTAVGANGVTYTLGWSIDSGPMWLGPNGEAVSSSDAANELGLPALGDSTDSASQYAGEAGNYGDQTGPCEASILSAANNRFGSNATTANISGLFNYSQGAPQGVGTLNLDISTTQPGSASPGRYPTHWWIYFIGYGATLHVPKGPGGADSALTLFFSPTLYTAHIDSAYAYNPIGLVLHLLLDMTGSGGYKQCP